MFQIQQTDFCENFLIKIIKLKSINKPALTLEIINEILLIGELPLEGINEK